MYIMINDIKGEKTIDLSYQIYSNAGQGKELQLLACISVILRFCYIDLQKCCPSQARKLC